MSDGRRWLARERSRVGAQEAKMLCGQRAARMESVGRGVEEETEERKRNAMQRGEQNTWRWLSGVGLEATPM